MSALTLKTSRRVRRRNRRAASGTAAARWRRTNRPGPRSRGRCARAAPNASSAASGSASSSVASLEPVRLEGRQAARGRRRARGREARARRRENAQTPSDARPPARVVWFAVRTVVRTVAAVLLVAPAPRPARAKTRAASSNRRTAGARGMERPRVARKTHDLRRRTRGERARRDAVRVEPPPETETETAPRSSRRTLARFESAVPPSRTAGAERREVHHPRSPGAAAALAARRRGRELGAPPRRARRGPSVCSRGSANASPLCTCAPAPAPSPGFRSHAEIAPQTHANADSIPAPFRRTQRIIARRRAVGRARARCTRTLEPLARRPGDTAGTAAGRAKEALGPRRRRRTRASPAKGRE